MVASHRARTIVVVALIGCVAVFGYVFVGSPGIGRNEEPTTAAYQRVTPEQFATRMDPGAFVVNVHVPYEGEIAGTDAFIPYDQIVGDPQLPSDRDTELLLYCRTGRMSTEAAAALADAGYTSVVELEGGMVAWDRVGRALRVDAGS